MAEAGRRAGYEGGQEAGHPVITMAIPHKNMTISVKDAVHCLYRIINNASTRFMTTTSLNRLGSSNEGANRKASILINMITPILPNRPAGSLVNIFLVILFSLIFEELYFSIFLFFKYVIKPLNSTHDIITPAGIQPR